MVRADDDRIVHAGRRGCLFGCGLASARNACVRASSAALERDEFMRVRQHLLVRLILVAEPSAKARNEERYGSEDEDEENRRRRFAQKNVPPARFFNQRRSLLRKCLIRSWCRRSCNPYWIRSEGRIERRH